MDNFLRIASALSGVAFTILSPLPGHADDASDLRAAANAQIDQNLARIRAQVPIQVSPTVKLTNAFRAGATITYSYETKHPNGGNVWTAAENKSALAETIRFACEGKNTRVLLDFGYALVYMHYDPNGIFIVQHYVDSTKCK